MGEKVINLLFSFTGTKVGKNNKKKICTLVINQPKSEATGSGRGQDWHAALPRGSGRRGLLSPSCKQGVCPN